MNQNSITEIFLPKSKVIEVVDNGGRVCIVTVQSISVRIDLDGANGSPKKAKYSANECLPGCSNPCWLLPSEDGAAYGEYLRLQRDLFQAQARARKLGRYRTVFAYAIEELPQNAIIESLVLAPRDRKKGKTVIPCARIFHNGAEWQIYWIGDDGSYRNGVKIFSGKEIRDFEYFSYNCRTA